MKLRYSPTSPYARKVRVVIAELEMVDRVELAPVDPWSDESLRPDNPLCKVPTLVLPDGPALFDSRVICEYFDALAGAGLFPAPGAERWAALRFQALGDGICDAAIRRLLEQRAPEAMRSAAVIERQSAAMAAALDMLEALADGLHVSVPTIGEIAVGVTLGYLDFRFAAEDWRPGRPRLSAWYETFAKRTAMQATEPPRT